MKIRNRNRNRNRKNIIRIISYFKTYIGILIFFILNAFIITCSSPAFAEKTPAEKFQEAMLYTNSLRDTVSTKALEFKPAEVFKNQKGGYTEEPSQINYYFGITQSNAHAMEKTALEEVLKDEDYKDSSGNPIPTAGKAVTKDFQTRPIYKITQDDEYMQKSQLAMKGAGNIVTGSSGKGISSKKSGKTADQTTYVEKTCNESIRTIRRVCEKAPKITTSIETFVYPNCRSLVLVEGTLENNGLCPYGYGTSDYMYMIRFSGPNVRFCVKPITIAEGTECFGGFFGAGIMHQNYRVSGTGTGMVPKKMKSRIRISHAYRGFIIGTIVNSTTGVVLYNKTRFNNGQTIELPFSETQDQTFRFYAEVQGWCRPLGIMTLYVDHYYKKKVAKLEPWEETCRDI